VLALEPGLDFVVSCWTSSPTRDQPRRMANYITLLRTLLSFVVVAMLHVRTKWMYVGAFVLTVLLIWMDGLDGYVARRRNENLKLGAVLDILADRVVETSYWIVFAKFGWVPLWVAILVSARGIVVDGIRALALERGMTAFGSTTMMRSTLGVLLVSSRLSRALYGIAKALAFSLLILAFAPGLFRHLGPIITWLAYASVYTTVVMCVIRGLPVVVEARRLVQR
jgi:CDP-diacylglycerol--glycerol-3-phosphate 3-phosphatidyltransferase